MGHRWVGLKVGVGLVTLALAASACKAGPANKPIKMGPVDTGPGSVEATRRALEGSWTLSSLQVVNAQGARRSIKATGQLQYDAFGNMTIHGIIEDPALRDTVVLDYDGRIVIDVARHQFYAENLTTDRPTDLGQLAPISPDKVRRYEISGNSLTVTYLDVSGKPTAVSAWRRSGSAGPTSPPAK